MEMMKQKTFEKAGCPVARSLDAIGDGWALLILRDAFEGKRRFGEFQKSLGVAKNILTVRLKKLVADGILTVAPASDGSAYQEYVLTAKGADLYLVLASIAQWGATHLFGTDEAPTYRVIDREKGEAVKPLELRAADGRVLKVTDVKLVVDAPTPEAC